MFDGLRGAFAGVTRRLAEKEITAGDVEGALADLEISLLESDVATEVVDGIRDDLRDALAGTKVDRREIGAFVRGRLESSVRSILDGAGAVDLLDLVEKKEGPFLVMFVGINGTGKTTTLAKVAHMLKGARRSVVVAAADTFRAGAIEQLRAHTDRLGIKLVAQNYESDPAAVARDAVLYARSHGTDCVLIDTAGRMQTSRNLMEQIAKITKVVEPDLKIFVGDSLAGNDTVSQARQFLEHTSFDASILTKADADARGGAALSIARITSTPVIYVGTGQEYGDLEPFDREAFVRSVLGDGPAPRKGDAPAREPGIKEPGAAPVPKDVPAQGPGPARGPAPGDGQKAPAPAAAESGVKRGDAAPADAPADAPGHGSAQSDPFAGISDGDIKAYSELHDLDPPEDDAEAARAAGDIRAWIEAGRPGSKGKKGGRRLFGFGR
ncbi:MAG: signal recognition particle-docking protein FtsY [Nitrosopumilus sp.]|nr:signal recognition particle-docking protein FtsY [Nitrosopumilus sp.]